MDRDTCYMCEKVSTSKEHVPPKCLFPEQKDLPEGADLRKNLIRVSSCDEHNSNKSKDDEYLLYALSMSIANNETAFRLFLTKILRSIHRNPRFFGAFTMDNKPVVAVDEKGTAFNTLIVKLDTRRILKVLDHIARALYFDHFKKRFLGKCVVLYDFALYHGTPQEEALNDKLQFVSKVVKDYFEKKEHTGDNPEVFRYVFDEPDAEDKIALKMQFYKASNVYAAFVPELPNH